MKWFKKFGTAPRSYVDTFTDGFRQGEEAATASGREYVERLCLRFIDMEDIEAIKLLCRNTIDTNRRASSTNDDS